MILGLSVETFALIHEIISIVGILSGLAVAAGLMIDTWLPRANILFLATTIATSVTGFMFHSQVFGAPQIIGVVSLIVLAVAMLALYRGKLSGFWKQTYVVAPVLALYLNALVFVVQAFQKVPFLNAFAPTQSKPPFIFIQVVVMFAFIATGYLGSRRFSLAPVFQG
jgi:hypothetical protein